MQMMICCHRNKTNIFISKQNQAQIIANEKETVSVNEHAGILVEGATTGTVTDIDGNFTHKLTFIPITDFPKSRTSLTGGPALLPDACRRFAGLSKLIVIFAGLNSM